MSFLGRLFRRGDIAVREVREPYRARASDSIDMLCLAFSRKLGGRCVAGLDLATGKWVRPVSDSEHGTLYDAHFRFRDGTEPRVMDVLRIPVLRSSPLAYQPENVTIAPEPWQLQARPGGPEMWTIVRKVLYRQPLLLGTPGDRRAEADFVSHPAEESLCVLQPAEVRFIHRTNDFSGHPQARMRFSFGGRVYFLALTDAEWERRTLGLAPGEHRPRDLGLDPARLLLVVSLGEPFEGSCYKLVAAVLQSAW